MAKLPLLVALMAASTTFALPTKRASVTPPKHSKQTPHCTAGLFNILGSPACLQKHQDQNKRSLLDSKAYSFISLPVVPTECGNWDFQLNWPVCLDDIATRTESHAYYPFPEVNHDKRRLPKWSDDQFPETPSLPLVSPTEDPKLGYGAWVLQWCADAKRKYGKQICPWRMARGINDGLSPPDVAPPYEHLPPHCIVVDLINGNQPVCASKNSANGTYIPWTHPSIPKDPHPYDPSAIPSNALFDMPPGTDGGRWLLKHPHQGSSLLVTPYCNPPDWIEHGGDCDDPYWVISTSISKRAQDYGYGPHSYRVPHDPLLSTPEAGLGPRDVQVDSFPISLENPEVKAKAQCIAFSNAEKISDCSVDESPESSPVQATHADKVSKSHRRDIYGFIPSIYLGAQEADAASDLEDAASTHESRDIYDFIPSIYLGAQEVDAASDLEDVSSAHESRDIYDFIPSIYLGAQEVDAAKDLEDASSADNNAAQDDAAPRVSLTDKDHRMNRRDIYDFIPSIYLGAQEADAAKELDATSADKDHDLSRRDIYDFIPSIYLGAQEVDTAKELEDAAPAEKDHDLSRRDIYDFIPSIYLGAQEVDTAKELADAAPAEKDHDLSRRDIYDFIPSIYLGAQELDAMDLDDAHDVAGRKDDDNDDAREEDDDDDSRDDDDDEAREKKDNDAQEKKGKDNDHAPFIKHTVTAAAKHEPQPKISEADQRLRWRKGAVLYDRVPNWLKYEVRHDAREKKDDANDEDNNAPLIKHSVTAAAKHEPQPKISKADQRLRWRKGAVLYDAREKKDDANDNDAPFIKRSTTAAAKHKSLPKTGKAHRVPQWLKPVYYDEGEGQPAKETKQPETWFMDRPFWRKLGGRWGVGWGTGPGAGRWPPVVRT